MRRLLSNRTDFAKEQADDDMNPTRAWRDYMAADMYPKQSKWVHLTADMYPKREKRVHVVGHVYPKQLTWDRASDDLQAPAPTATGTIRQCGKPAPLPVGVEANQLTNEAWFK